MYAFHRLGGCNTLCGAVKTSTQIAFEGGPETLKGAKPFYVRLFEDIVPYEVHDWNETISPGDKI